MTMHLRNCIVESLLEPAKKKDEPWYKCENCDEEYTPHNDMNICRVCAKQFLELTPTKAPTARKSMRGVK